MVTRYLAIMQAVIDQGGQRVPWHDAKRLLDPATLIPVQRRPFKIAIQTAAHHDTPQASVPVALDVAENGTPQRPRASLPRLSHR